MSDEIWRWDASEIAQAIRNGAISAREAVDACLARMVAVNPRLNAVTVDLSASARDEAGRADQAVARGEPLGPLHGVPVTIKENVDQKGCATTNGVVAFRDLIATDDSPVVANWKRAGAIVVGRTNTPAFSFRLDTVNDLRGRTFNPWSTLHTPGGSSGGASASVAAGITPLAHGNDIAGSVRYPAYACGLVGLRPSFGRVPAFNPSAASERSMSSQLMSVQGPLARSVRDVRLGLAAMAVRDARDPWWCPAPLEGDAPTRPLRIAVVRDPGKLAGAALAPAIDRALTQATSWLTEAGYEIRDDASPGFTRAFELWFDLQMPEFAEFMQPQIEAHGDEGIRTAVRYMLANVAGRSPLPYMRALAERTRLVREWNRFMEDVPLVLTAVCSEPVYRQGFDVESAARTAAMWRECATMMAVPVLGLPAIAVPTGVADGLPLGVQIVGPRFREDLCLAAAEVIEARARAAGPLTPLDPRA